MPHGQTLALALPSSPTAAGVSGCRSVKAQAGCLNATCHSSQSPPKCRMICQRRLTCAHVSVHEFATAAAWLRYAQSIVIWRVPSRTCLTLLPVAHAQAT